MFIVFENQIVRPITGAQDSLRTGLNAHAALYGVATGSPVSRSTLKDKAAFWPEDHFTCPGCQRQISMARHFAAGRFAFCSPQCAKECPSLFDARRHVAAPCAYLDAPSAMAKSEMLNAYRAMGNALHAGATHAIAQWMQAFGLYSAFSFDLASMALCKHDPLPNGTSQSLTSMLNIASDVCVLYHNLGHYSVVAQEVARHKERPGYVTEDDLLNESLARRVAVAISENVVGVANCLFDSPSTALHAAGDRVVEAWNDTLAGSKPPYRIGDRNDSDLNARRN